LSVVDVQEAKASRTIHSLTHSNSRMQVKVLFVVIAVTIMAITVVYSAEGGISSSGKTTSNEHRPWDKKKKVRCKSLFFGNVKVSSESVNLVEGTL
jgi:hypothetical protein